MRHCRITIGRVRPRRVQVFLTALAVVAGGSVAMPATAGANTVVGCDTPGLIAAVNAAVTAGSGTLNLTPGCTYKLSSADASGFGLPVIFGNITIHGNGATITRLATAPQFGLMSVFGTLAMDHLSLTGGNSTTDGGAIQAIGSSTVTLTDSTVSGNTATGPGGAFFFNQGNYVVSGSTISGNSSATSGGGAIFNDGGTETITNTTITGNTAPDNFAGAMYNFANNVTITNSTLSGNSAGGGGGGLYNDFSSGGTVTIVSSIVSANVGGNCDDPDGPPTSGGYNIDSDGSCGLATPTDLDSVDPVLGPLEGNGGPTETMAPGSASPAIDAIPSGTNGCGAAIKGDQRSVSRPQGPGCDIGAYESGDVAVHGLKATPKTVASGAKVVLTATLNNAGAVDATGVKVTDKLPSGLSFVSATASLGKCSFAAPKVTCVLGQFPAATAATVTITATVTAAPLSLITDKAIVSATTGDTIHGNDSRTVDIKVK